MPYLSVITENIPGIWSLFVFLLAASLIPKVLSWIRIYLLVRKLPGPKGHFIYGNLREFFSKDGLLVELLKWSEKFPNFNKAFASFYPFVLIQSPEAVQIVLGRNKHAEKGFIYKSLKPILGDGLIMSKGEKWHGRRKLITPTFHFNILENFVDVFVSRTRDFMDRLENTNKDGFINICEFVRTLTLDFICETAMGISAESTVSKEKRSKLLHGMHKLENIGAYRMIRPWYLVSDTLFKLSKIGRQQEMYKKIVHEFTDEIIEERRKAVNTQKPEESDCPKSKRKAIFIDLLLENSKNEELTNQDIREEVNAFIFAGQATTELAITYCLYLLGLNPDAQEKVHQEMMDIFGTSDRAPTIYDFKEMKYLDMCIKEAMRLYPSVPVIARRLSEDERIGKYLLPKNVDILIMPYVLHRNPQQFPNPEEFNPDNFLPERVKARHPYSYIPFSAGPRNCIGQKFAILAEKTVISSIIRKYKITSKNPREEMKLIPVTVLLPKNGVKLKLTDRNST